MITSKRDLKKHIDRIEDEVVQVVVPAAVYAGLLTEEKATELLSKLAGLTQQAKERLSINFDKSPDAFDSHQAFKLARTQYFKAAYNKALSEYEAEVQKLIDPINEAAKANK
ncbi:MAG: hypothetical protein LIP09_01415 [Bacteroidales bacterium]|nr:hypothetical protein [Bacteroidales bacterium]